MLNLIHNLRLIEETLEKIFPLKDLNNLNTSELVSRHHINRLIISFYHLIGYQFIENNKTLAKPGFYWKKVK